MVSAATLSHFLIGLGQKTIVAVIKKLKEQQNTEEAANLHVLLEAVELSKPLGKKLTESITVSLQTLRLPSDVVDRLRELNQDALFQAELASAYISGIPVEEEWIRILVVADPLLSAHAVDIRKLATTWLEGVDYAIAAEPALLGLLTLRGQRSQQKTLHDISTQLAGEQLRQSGEAQTQHQLLVDVRDKLSRLQGASVCLMVGEAEAYQASSVLRSQHQRAFDTAREELLKGSIIRAETGYRTLIADLIAAGVLGDKELLLRSYVNLSTCFLEQQKFSEAAEMLEVAEKLNPTDSRVNRHRAVYLSRIGKTEDALILVRALRVLEPNKGEHKRNEISLLLDLNRPSEAISLLEEDLDLDADHWSQFATAYQRSGNYVEAVVAARKACDLAPDREGPWIALAYSLGFPIIERRMSGTTEALTADTAELPQLREAIASLEKAASILRKRARIPVLGEVLTNLIAFYSALDDEQRALAVALELLAIGDNSPLALQNLYFVQMRTQHYDDALVTARKLTLIARDINKARLREANTLLAIGKCEDVISLYESSRTESIEQDINAEWIALAAAAFAESLRSEHALRLLQTALKDYNHPSLLLERARIQTHLGNLTAAALDFAEAERLAGASSQAAMDYGLLHYRNNNWPEALSRFRRFGAESSVNPLHERYLICLFNTGEYIKCLDLITQWNLQGNGYNETIYALAARCHHLAYDLMAARKYLLTLVAKGGEHSQSHKRMLGYIFYSLDELEEAYDLISRLVTDEPSDVQAKLLLSAICVAQGKRTEAIDQARAAVAAAPDNLQARGAFFSAMLRLPDHYPISSDILAAHHQNVQQLSSHPSGVLQAIRIDDQLQDFRAMLEKREQHVNELDRLYRGNNLPFGFLAKQSGTPFFELWKNSICHEQLGIRMSSGVQIEQDDQIKLATNSNSIVVDLTALFTLQGLGLLKLLPQLYPNIYAHITTLEELIAHRRQLEQLPHSGSVASIKGQLVHTTTEKSEIQATLVKLKELSAFLKSSEVILVGLMPTPFVDEARKAIEGACGAAATSCIYVGKERLIPLYSDDFIIRCMAQNETKVAGFCTQAVLRAALTRELITPLAYENSVLQLWDWHYGFVSESAETLKVAFRKASGKVTPSIDCLLRRTQNAQCSKESATPILAEFLAYVCVSSIQGGDPHSTWATIIWESFLKAKPSRQLIRQFLAVLGAHLAFLPEKFFDQIILSLQVSGDSSIINAVALEALGMALAFADRALFTISNSENIRHQWLLHREGFARRVRWNALLPEKANPSRK